MANTYSKVYLHIVFAVKNRNSLIPALHLPRIHSYISGLLQNHGHYPLAVGGIDSHVHILVNYNIKMPIPEMVRALKTSTSHFINESCMIPFRFEWQTGYGCFSYAQSQIDAVCHYIRTQNEHHKSITLEDEIKTILTRFDIDFDEKYIIKDPE